MIKKINARTWKLYTKDGSRVLGTHRTKKEAVAQERAVSISKARAAGHYIPRPPLFGRK